MYCIVFSGQNVAIGIYLFIFDNTFMLIVKYFLNIITI